VFTCKVTGPGILKWGIDPYVDIDHNPIRFRLRDKLKVGYRVNGTDGLYNATVISFSRNPNIRLLGNLTSELSVLAVSGQRIQVQCDDGTTGRQTADMPPAGKYVKDRFAYQASYVRIPYVMEYFVSQYCMCY